MLSFPPDEFPELQEPNLRHFDSAVSFNAPKEIGTAPGEQAVSTRSIPKKAKDEPHGSEYNVSGTSLVPLAQSLSALDQSIALWVKR